VVKKLGRAVGASLIWSDSTAAGYPDQALERAHEAISRGRAQLPVHLGGSLNYGGQIPICRGDAPTVLEWAEECLGFAERLGLEFHIGFAKVNRGWAYARLGRAEEGITEIRDGIPKWRASGFESWAARHLILLSEVSIEAGRLEDANASADEALISIRETSERQFESYALIAKGDVLRTMDREDKAHVVFTMPLTSPAPNPPSRGSFAPRPVSPACGIPRAIPPMPATSSPPSTAGSPRGSTPPI